MAGSVGQTLFKRSPLQERVKGTDRFDQLAGESQTIQQQVRSFS
jgi:hypothetical protein